MFQYLEKDSLKLYPELKAFIEETNPAHYAEHASKLKKMYKLEFLIPKHVFLQMFPHKAADTNNFSSSEQKIDETMHTESIIAYLCGIDKLEVLFTDNKLKVNSPIQDFYLSAALVGGEERAKAILLRLKRYREDTEFKETLMEQVATALFSCASLESGIAVLDLLKIVHDSRTMVMFLEEMKTNVNPESTFVLQVIDHVIETTKQLQTDSTTQNTENMVGRTEPTVALPNGPRANSPLVSLSMHAENASVASASHNRLANPARPGSR